MYLLNSAIEIDISILKDALLMTPVGSDKWRVKVRTLDGEYYVGSLSLEKDIDSECNILYIDSDQQEG